MSHKTASYSALVLLLLLVSPYFAGAQHCRFFDLTFTDSLVAKTDVNVLYNNIKLSNPGRKSITAIMKIDVPDSWKELSKSKYLADNEVYFRLSPGQVKNIPFNLLKTPKATAMWDSVTVAIWVPGVTDTHFYYIHVRAEPNYRFNAEHLTEDIYLEDKPDHIALSVSIKNTGNAIDTYTLKWQNSQMDLDDNVQVVLAPGQDSIYTHIVKMPHSAWAGLYNKSIGLVISGHGSASYSHTYNVSRPKSSLKKFESAYPVIPLKVEAGTIIQGKEQYYYGGARGNLEFGEEHELEFYYRSKQFGNERFGIQRNMYLVDYRYHHWKLSVGLFQQFQQFFATSGRGASISYDKDATTGVAFSAILKDPNFYYTSDNFSLMARYALKKIQVRQVVSANYDYRSAINGYVVSNEVFLLNTEKLKIDVTANAGLEQKTRDVPGVSKETSGLGVGYSLSYQKGTWAVLSGIEYNNSNFPGLKKGMRLHNHRLNKQFGNMFGSLFYSANIVNATNFRDTLYNTDILKYNNERLGFTIGIKDEHSSISLSSGLLNQTGLVSGLDQMYFADINCTWAPRKDIMVTVNSQNAFKNDADIRNNDVYMTSSMASLKFWWLGFSGSYTTRPVFEKEGNGQALRSYDETISGGPFLNYNFFRNRLTGTVRYQLSKSVYDQVLRKSVGAVAGYNSQKFGTSIQFNANFPVGTTSTVAGIPFFEERFITLSVIQPLNVPVLSRRKYYDLHISAYYDENNNDKRDKNEKELARTRIDIGDHDILYTNKNGDVSYKNIEKGTYIVRPHTFDGMGLVPKSGYEQTVHVDRNVNMEIAYNKGKLVKGKIDVFNDSFSRRSLGADRLKVTATDSTGKRFVTFSNNAGEFTFHLPSGIYSIALNQDAFRGTDFKPEQISFNLDLIKDESGSVHFVIKQKPRKVRFLENN